MFFEYLEHIRNKSVEARKRFAYVFTSFLTGVIILLWLSVHLAGKPTTETAPAGKDPLGTITKSFTQTVQSTDTDNAPVSNSDRAVQFSNSYTAPSGSSTSPSQAADASASTSPEQLPPAEMPTVSADDEFLVNDILDESAE
jgi:hypothetical protein